MSEYDWRAHVRYRPELDGLELFVFRKVYGATESVSVDNGRTRITRTSDHNADIPPLINGADAPMLKAIAESIREYFGAPQHERVLEQRAAASDAGRDYAQGLNDKLLGIIERKLFQE